MIFSAVATVLGALVQNFSGLYYYCWAMKYSVHSAHKPFHKMKKLNTIYINFVVYFILRNHKNNIYLGPF